MVPDHRLVDRAVLRQRAELVPLDQLVDAGIGRDLDQRLIGRGRVELDLARLAVGVVLDPEANGGPAHRVPELEQFLDLVLQARPDGDGELGERIAPTRGCASPRPTPAA